MTDFVLRFSWNACQELDDFALLACQDYNLGNTNNWLQTFRGGLYGFYARIHGVETHYRMVHAWLPKRRSPIETEFHLTSIFFNMDSALECFTFALNSLGFVAAPKWFRDITDDKVLSKVYPTDIIGKLNTNPEDPPYAGYSRIFPTLQTHWQANKKLISHITEQHDVSKHRKAICHGGKARSDPPPGFYEGLGIGDDPSQQSEYWAMAEIIFQKNPKGANVNGKPLAAGDQMLLEPLAVRFCEFINESSAKVLHDTRTKINLPHKALIK